MTQFRGHKQSMVRVEELLKQEPLLRAGDLPFDFVYGGVASLICHVMIKDNIMTVCGLKPPTIDKLSRGYICDECFKWASGFIFAWKTQIKLIHYPEIQGLCPHCTGDCTLFADGAVQCKSCLCIWTNAQVLMAKMCNNPEPLWHEFAREYDMTSEEIIGERLE